MPSVMLLHVESSNTNQRLMFTTFYALLFLQRF